MLRAIYSPTDQEDAPKSPFPFWRLQKRCLARARIDVSAGMGTGGGNWGSPLPSEYVFHPFQAPSIPEGVGKQQLQCHSPMQQLFMQLKQSLWRQSLPWWLFSHPLQPLPEWISWSRPTMEEAEKGCRWNSHHDANLCCHGSFSSPFNLWLCGSFTSGPHRKWLKGVWHLAIGPQQKLLKVPFEGVLHLGVIFACPGLVLSLMGLWEKGGNRIYIRPHPLFFSMWQVGFGMIGEPCLCFLPMLL